MKGDNLILRVHLVHDLHYGYCACCGGWVSQNDPEISMCRGRWFGHHDQEYRDKVFAEVRANPPKTLEELKAIQERIKEEHYRESSSP